MKRTGEQIRTDWQRFMRLQWIWERTRFEYVERWSEPRRREYEMLADRVKSEMKKIDPTFRTPYYGFNPTAYLEYMKRRWWDGVS